MALMTTTSMRDHNLDQNADAVSEVPAEGGMTRFINIFYQSDTTYHGPIRSARPTDPTVLRPLGGVLEEGATVLILKLDMCTSDNTEDQIILGLLFKSPT